MAEVNVVSYVEVGGRRFPIKGIDPFLSEFADTYIEATAVQLRLLAYGYRDLLIDKILAQDPAGGIKRVYRKRVGRVPPEPPEAAEEQELEPDLYYDPQEFKRGEVLPPHHLGDVPRGPRVPFPFKKLSKDRIKKKIREGLDGRTLVASGDYLRGIMVKRQKVPGKGTIYKVTMANRKHKTTGIPLKRLSRLIEFGTREYTVPLFGDKQNLVTVKIQQRPHWIPAFEELKTELPKVEPEIRARSLRETIRKLK